MFYSHRTGSMREIYQLPSPLPASKGSNGVHIPNTLSTFNGNDALTNIFTTLGEWQKSDGVRKKNKSVADMFLSLY
jgi:hypothetical protein